MKYIVHILIVSFCLIYGFSIGQLCPSAPIADALINDCGPVTFHSGGTPELKVSWYWQTEPNSISTEYLAASNSDGFIDFYPFTISQTGTYYVRSKRGHVWGCSTSFDAFVAEAPASFNVIGGGDYCEDYSNIQIKLSDSEIGVNYQLKRGSSAYRSAKAGTGGQLTWNNITSSGDYTVEANNSDCIELMNGNAVISIDKIPLSYKVSGGGKYCIGDSQGRQVVLSNSEVGVSYQLYRNSSANGSAISGTGNVINWNNLKNSGTYTVKAIRGNCSKIMDDNATISRVSKPQALPITSVGAYCVSNPPYIILESSENGVSYQLKKDNSNTYDPIIGTGNTISWEVRSSGLYTVKATRNGCSQMMQNDMNIFLEEAPEIKLLNGGGELCSDDTQGKIIYISHPQEFVSYYLLKNNVMVEGSTEPSDGQNMISWFVTEAGSYTAEATSTIVSQNCVASMDGQVEIIVKPAPAIFNIIGGGNYCEDDNIQIQLSGSEIGVDYQLNKDSSPYRSAKEGTGGLLTWDNITLSGNYSVEANNSNCNKLMNGNAIINIDKIPLSYVVSGGGTYCIGNNGLQVELSDSEVGVNYQLYRDSTAIGSVKQGTGNEIVWNNLTNSGTYTMKGIRGMCSKIMNESASISRISKPLVLPIKSVGDYCAIDTPVIILESSESGVTYYLKKDDIIISDPIDGSGNTISWEVESSGLYTVMATRNGCTKMMENDLNIVLEPPLETKLLEGGGILCQGDSPSPNEMIFISHPQEFVSYYLLKNNTMVEGSKKPSDGQNMITWFVAEAGVYRAEAIYTVSSQNCATPMNGEVEIIVNPRPQAIIAEGTSILDCVTGQDVLSAELVDGATYQWYKDGTLLPGKTNQSLTVSSLGDYHVRLTSEHGCFKNSEVVTVHPCPILSIQGGNTALNFGESATLELNHGDYEIYEWYRDGVQVASNTSSTRVESETGRYYVKVFSNGDSETSNYIDLFYKGNRPDGSVESIESTSSEPNQTDPGNYVRTYTTQIALSSIGDMASTAKEEVQVSTTYFDGLGRPIQSVNKEASPLGNDIIQPIFYDGYGRQSKSFLPFSQNQAANSGNFLSTALSDQNNFYSNGSSEVAQSGYAYSESAYDRSPLNRVVKQASPGESWKMGSNREVKFDRSPFSPSTHGDVFEIKISADELLVKGVSTNILIKENNFKEGDLYVTKTTDEQGNNVEEFTNHLGQTLLKQVDAPSGKASTYYVYDDMGRLRFVLPPEASKNFINDYQNSASKSNYIDHWAFVYNYDQRGRMIEKKVPGSGWVYMVYDDRDRLVLTQDAEQRLNEDWLFTKYDVLNRPILTGTYHDESNTNRIDMQNHVNSFYSPTSQYFETLDGSIHGYTNISFPLVSNVNNYLTVSYYDNYEFMSSWNGYSYDNFQLGCKTTQDIYCYPGSANSLVKGQMTGSIVKNLEDNNWYERVNYYDDRYRIIQTITKNYLGGLDRTSNLYDFIGKILETKTSHDNGINTTNIIRNYDYDHAGRLLAVFHRMSKDIEFIDLEGTSLINANSIIKTNGTGWGNGGAASIDIIRSNEDGYVQYVASQTGHRKMMGLSVENLDAHYNSIKYALHHRDNNVLAVYINGAFIKEIGSYDIGDVLRVERIGSEIKFIKNGIVLHSISCDSSEALLADFSLYHINSTFENVTISGSKNIILSSNKYNELSELVSKKLYSDDNGTTFQQATDYRYNIRGWLTKINDAELTNTQQGSVSDLFGMELSYDHGFDVKQYNGNISGVKWKTFGDQRATAYGYLYDPMNRIVFADYVQKEAAVWAINGGNFNIYLDEYDLNGNIKHLTRWSNKNGTAKIDDLEYNYGAKGNQLQSVTDALQNSFKEDGFKDGNTSGNDYQYDANGNMTQDLNKEITQIQYNYLNLPETVTKADGQYIKYIYDASGVKLAQEVHAANDDLIKRTDYIGEFIYETEGTNPAELALIQHEEGRIVPGLSGDWEYQYHLKDHLGNTRVTFTTKPKTLNFKLNYESDPNLPDDEGSFDNLDNIIPADIHDHTDAGSTYDKSQLLNGATGGVVGSVLTIPVGMGDKIDASVYAKYLAAESTPNPTAAVGSLVIGAITGSTGTLNYEGAINSSFGTSGSMVSGVFSDQIDDNVPRAYINLMFLPDEVGSSIADSHFIFAQLSSASSNNHALLELPETYVAPSAGYIVVYLSNESANLTEVYFDDLKVTVNEHPVIQKDDYYPFGLTFNSYSRVTAKENNFLYNGKERMNDLDLGWDDFGWRMYDPTIARWNKIDNHAENYYTYSPYNFVLNNPVNIIDPDGNDIYILTWFSEDGETGHAGIAIDNYKTQEKKDKDGNTVYDDDGNAVTEQVKDGTVTYYDLWPNDPVGKTELQDDVDADYTEGRVMTLDALKNTDPTNSRDGNVSPEGRKADGIVQLSTTASQDARAKSTANGLVSGNGKYNACSNNCSTFTQNVLNSVFPGVEASQQVRPSGALQYLYDDASVVAPNNLYNAALKVKGAKRVRGPEKAETKPYLEYFGKSNREN